MSVQKKGGIMKTVVISLVFLMSVAMASSDLPNGVEYSQAPQPIYSSSDNTASLGVFYNSPVAYSLMIRDEGPSFWPESDWSIDVLVSAKVVGSGQDFDVDEDTDDIYACIDTDHATNDSLVVYRSQDGGATWSLWRVTYNPSGVVDNPRIRVVKNASNQTWVCMFFLNGTTLYMRRMTPDQSSSAYEIVTADPVLSYDVDGEIGTGGYVYVTYVPDATGNDIWAARNALAGAGWVNNTSLFVDPAVTPYPSIAVATGGVISVSFVDNRITTNPEVRIKTSTNYASSWGGSSQVSNNSGAYDLVGTSMAYSHAATATGWIFTTFDTGSSDNLGYYYSTNSGSSWAYGAIMAGSGDENMADIRTRKSSGSATLAFNSDPGDSTMFSWTTPTNPTGFVTPDRVNDYPSTGYWPPAAGWVEGNSAVLYTSWTMNYNSYFDWYGNVAVEEETSASMTTTMQISSSPNPFTDIATINFSVTGTDPVSISVYNISGRLVETIVDNAVFSPGDHSVQWNGLDSNGSAAVPGVYFCRLNTGGTMLTNRMVMVR